VRDVERHRPILTATDLRQFRRTLARQVNNGYDIDGDGNTDPAEIALARLIDSDGDGQVTEKEIKAFIDSQHALKMEQRAVLYSEDSTCSTVQCRRHTRKAVRAVRTCSPPSASPRPRQALARSRYDVRM
jgi:hypothetical protein